MKAGYKAVKEAITKPCLEHVIQQLDPLVSGIEL